MMSPPIALVEDDLLSLTSQFQRRSVLEDASRAALAFVNEAKPDTVIIDLIDDRFDLWDIDGRLLVNSYELHVTKVIPKKFPQARRIDRLSPECTAIWKNAADQLYDLLRATGATIILHRGLLQTHVATREGGREPWPDELTVVDRKVGLTAVNEILQDYYDHLAVRDGVKLLKASEANQVSAYEHQWQPHPVHYVTEYYLDCFRMLPPLK